MKTFKVKLHEYKQKIENARRKIRKILLVLKLRLLKTVGKIERKLGLEQRCSVCPERIFCESYSGRKVKKDPFYVERCHSKISTK